MFSSYTQDLWVIVRGLVFHAKESKISYYRYYCAGDTNAEPTGKCSADEGSPYMMECPVGLYQPVCCTLFFMHSNCVKPVQRSNFSLTDFLTFLLDRFYSLVCIVQHF